MTFRAQDKQPTSVEDDLFLLFDFRRDIFGQFRLFFRFSHICKLTEQPHF